MFPLIINFPFSSSVSSLSIMMDSFIFNFSDREFIEAGEFEISSRMGSGFLVVIVLGILSQGLDRDDRQFQSK